MFFLSQNPAQHEARSNSLNSLPERQILVDMLNILSILIGCAALVLAIPAFIPFLGWANWLVVPLAIVGLALGAMSDRNAGRNLNIVVILVGVGRLMLGGGIF
jgi:hypothetical protein